MNDSNAKKPSPRNPRKWWAPTLAIVAISSIIGVGLWKYANHIAKRQLEHQLTAATGLEASADVSIGPRGITARNVMLGSPSNPTVVMDSMTVEASLRQLFSDAPKIDNIRLDLSALRLTADEDGKIQWPFEGDGETELPSERVEIVNATVTIDQPFRKPLTIDGVNLVLLKNGVVVEVNGNANIADSNWQVIGESQPDGQFRAELQTERFVFNPKKLAMLSLVPNFISRLPVSAKGRVTAVVSKGDGNGPMKTSVKVDDVSVQLPQLGLSFADASARIDLQDSQVGISGLSARLGDGHVAGEATVVTSVSPFTGDLHVTLSDIPADQVRHAFSLPAFIDGVATGEISGKLTAMESGSLSIAMQGTAEIADATVKGIHIDSAVVSLDVQEFTLSDAKTSVLGTATFKELGAKNVALSELLDALEVNVKEFPVDGEITGLGTLTIPLQTADEISSWTAIGGLTTDQVTSYDLSATKGSANFVLNDGVLRLDDVKASMADHGLLTGSLTWPVANSGPAMILLNAESVPAAALLGRMANNQASNISADVKGGVAVTIDLRFPTDSVRNIYKWSGTLSASSPSLSWDDLELRDLSASGRVSNGAWDIKGAALKIPNGGTIKANATLPLIDQGRLEVAFAGEAIDVAYILKLAAKLDRIPPNLAIQKEPQLVIGTLKVRGRLEADATELSNPRAWRVETRIDSNDLTFAGERIRSLSSNMNLRDGLLEIPRADARLEGDGYVLLTASAPIAEVDGKPACALRWNDVPIGLITQLTGMNLIPRGTTSGRFNASSRGGAIETIKSFSGQGVISVSDAAINDVRFGHADAKITVNAGRLVIQDIRLTDHAADVCTGKLAINLFAPFAYAAAIDLHGLPLAERLSTLGIGLAQGEKAAIQNTSGILSLNAKVTGRLTNPELQVHGNGAIQELVVGGQPLDPIRFEVANAGADRMRVDADVFGGHATVELDLPNSSATEKRMSVTANDVDVSPLASLVDLEKYDVEVSGTLNGSLVIVAWDKPEVRQATIQLQNAKIAYAGIPLRDASAEVVLQPSGVEAKLVGTALDGELTIQSTTAIGSRFDSVIPLEIQLNAGKLVTLGNTAPRYSHLRPLSGSADMQLNLLVDSQNRTVTGEGEVALQQVSWDRQQMSRSSQARVRIDDGFLRLENLTAGVAGGNVHGNVSWPLDRKSTGRYNLNVRRVNLSEAARLASFEIPRTRGTVDARLTGRIGPKIVGRADIEVDHLALSGLDANSIRLPISYSIRVDDMSGKVVMRRASARLANGQVLTDGNVEFGRRRSFDLKIELSQLDSAELLSAIAGPSSYNQGRLSGTLLLKSTAARSLRDLDGRFRGKLEGAQAMQLPVLSGLAGFANVGRITRSSFDSQEIDLRLANGVISTPGLVFQSDHAELFVQGTATIDQRLDLDVALQTGNISPDFGLYELIESPIGRLATPGISTVVQALDFLSNRVVYVHVGGTVRNPHFRLRTDQLLQDALLQYYLPTPQFQQIQKVR